MKKKIVAHPIALKKLNIHFLAFIFVLCVFLIFSSVSIILQFKKYAFSTNQSTIISHAAINLQEGSDYLTEEARLFVITTEYIHLENYFYEINNRKRRETAISELKENAGNSKAIDFLEMALAESYTLEQQEMYALRLVVEGKHFDKNPAYAIPTEITQIRLLPEDAALSDDYKVAKAWLIMFSEEYLSQKQIISSYKSQAMNEILDYSDEILYQSYEKLKNNFIKMVFAIGLIFIFNLSLFIVIIYFVILPLYKHIKNISEGHRLDKSNTQEFNILTDTFNEMFDKNEANEILLKHKAEHDELTGVLNRSAFTQIKLAYTNSTENIALIIIDIDFFKLINDNYGHSTGDLVLQRVAKVLKDNFRNSDYVTRVGGDEFVIVLTNCDANQEVTKKLISTKLNQIKETLAEKIENIPNVTLSCGVELSATGYSDRLYEHADAALYEVKRAGRNDFRFYSDDLDSILEG